MRNKKTCLTRTSVQTDHAHETLRQMIIRAEKQFIEMEVRYSDDLLSVQSMEARVFLQLHEYYLKHDQLLLLIQYRQNHLDKITGALNNTSNPRALPEYIEQESECIRMQYFRARATKDMEYGETSSRHVENIETSDGENNELKLLFKRLAKLYHPDRVMDDEELYPVYLRIMQDINSARDRGDVDLLRMIANDPAGYFVHIGYGSYLTSMEFDIARLESILKSIQDKTYAILRKHEVLHKNPLYELHRSCLSHPDLFDKAVDEQIAILTTKIAQLEINAKELSDLINDLTGERDLFE